MIRRLRLTLIGCFSTTCCCLSTAIETPNIFSVLGGGGAAAGAAFGTDGLLGVEVDMRVRLYLTTCGLGCVFSSLSYSPGPFQYERRINRRFFGERVRLRGSEGQMNDLRRGINP